MSALIVGLMASGSQQVLGQVAAMAGAALATAVVSSIELAEPQNTPRVEVRVAYVAKDSITNVFGALPHPAHVVLNLTASRSTCIRGMHPRQINQGWTVLVLQ